MEGGPLCSVYLISEAESTQVELLALRVHLTPVGNVSERNLRIMYHNHWCHWVCVTVGVYTSDNTTVRLTSVLNKKLCVK